MNFLKAYWRNLIMINYAVNPEVLKPYLPMGTELDLWEGKAYVSLVAFTFEKMRVMGVPAVGFQNFEEVNLRFYVTRKEGETVKRGVAFVKEFVPKKMICTVANQGFHENYEAIPMQHKLEETEGGYRLIHLLGKANEHKISCAFSGSVAPLKSGSFSEFIAEHYWGYSRVSDLKTIEYEVQHPKWKQYELKNLDLEVDFSKMYGENWRFLNNEKPIDPFIAIGSEISVGFPNVII